MFFLNHSVKCLTEVKYYINTDTFINQTCNLVKLGAMPSFLVYYTEYFVIDATSWLKTELSKNILTGENPSENLQNFPFVSNDYDILLS